MNGRDFEHLCHERIKALNKLGLMHGGKYGVKVSFQNRVINGASVMVPVAIPSMPDFEGVLPPAGRQFVFDCKVVSDSSMDFDKYGDQQKDFMLDRARMGALCFYLILFKARQTMRLHFEQAMYAFPVAANEFWIRAGAGSGGPAKRINREDCERYGVRVEFTTLSPRERTPRPDVLGAITALLERVDQDGKEGSKTEAVQSGGRDAGQGTGRPW